MHVLVRVGARVHNVVSPGGGVRDMLAHAQTIQQVYDDGNELYSNSEFAAAVPYVMFAANEGHPDAMLLLAAMYLRGRGVPEDASETVKWYVLAAEQGHAEAQFQLGYMYRFGRLVQKDHNKAVVWFRLAAAQGDPRSQNCLGICHEYGQGVEQDLFKAFEWYSRSAHQVLAPPLHIHMLRNQP